MTRLKITASLAAIAALALGCPSDDATDTNSNDESSSTGNSTTMSTTMSTTTMSTTTASTTDTTTVDTTADTTDTNPSTEESSSSTTVDPTIFMFNETPPDQYVRVDRMGFPAVNTALHIGGDKDAYNQESPETDAGAFLADNAAEITDSLRLLHYGPEDGPGGDEGLDDEIHFLLDMLTPSGSPQCSPPGPGIGGQCANQGGAAAVIPDTLKLDLDLPNGFHVDPDTCLPVANGRALADPAIDIYLAILMLDLSEPDFPEGSVGFQCDAECDPDADDCPHARATTFLNIPGGIPMLPADAFSLNPISNDVAFEAEFPYLAAAHAP